MKILVKRTGGFAGLSDEATINTAELDSNLAQQIEQMFQNINFFDLPAIVSEDIICADLFHYEITATEGNQNRTIAFDSGGSETEKFCEFGNNLIQIAPAKK